MTAPVSTALCFATPNFSPLRQLAWRRYIDFTSPDPLAWWAAHHSEAIVLTAVAFATLSPQHHRPKAPPTLSFNVKASSDGLAAS